MKVTALIENTAPDAALRCEHGLSLCIEHEGWRCLLDAGASPALLDNAAALGIDLSAVDAAVLSHGHYDHSGGFAAFLDGNDRAPLYLRPQAAEPSWRVRKDGERKYLGVPPELLERRDRLRFVTGPGEIHPGVWLLPHTVPGLEKRGEKVAMYRQGPDGLHPDDFAHEQTLVVLHGTELAIFSSCSHAGADTVVEEVQAAFPGKTVRAFFGGFHLMGAGGAATLGVRPEAARALGERFLSLPVAEVWTGHCTGLPAFDLLRPILAERLHYLSAGTVVRLWEPTP